jgi:hypothetical protein
MTTGLLARDVWRESLEVAKRAGISWIKRPFFAWRVVRHWQRHHNLEASINDALSAYVWEHLD